MGNNNYGVISEQGFVEGSGLGFEPVKETELQKDNFSKEEDNKEETAKE